MAAVKEKFFEDLQADDDPEVTQIESLCVNCEEQGVTRLLLTKIPFFREVIIGSFSCDHCNYSNSELQPSGKIQDKGVNFRVRCTNVKDLNRQIVQSSYATVTIPSLEFESPPGTGVLTTVEGIISRAIDGLNQDQVLRKIQHPEAAAQIAAFVVKLEALKQVHTPFELVVDDPTGNSYIENFRAPNVDPELSVSRYTRSEEQDQQLGLLTGAEAGDAAANEKGFTGENEVMQFEIPCPNCQVMSHTNMKLVDIPHFKKVVLMVTVCDTCGYKESEVKGGAGIEPQGIRLDLHVTNTADMARDVIKSETSRVEIPEIEFETQAGSLGGKFTTVEGLLLDIKAMVKDSNPFLQGDSSVPNLVSKLDVFCTKLDKIINGEVFDVHVILEDPAGNSYIENPHAPDEDPELKVTKFDRSFNDNEELGLNDMKTENYEHT